MLLVWGCLFLYDVGDAYRPQADDGVRVGVNGTLQPLEVCLEHLPLFLQRLMLGWQAVHTLHKAHT